VDDAKYVPPKSAKRTKKQPVVAAAPESTDDEEECAKSPKGVSSPTGTGGSKRKRRNADNVTMDLKDMVVKKRMASLNASAILAASYSTEKKSSPPKGVQESPKKSATSSEASSERSEPEDDAEDEDSDGHRDSAVVRVAASALRPALLPPVVPPPSSQLAVIVNQDTDVTITTGVYVNSTTRSTRHEEFCTISGLQYRISSTSHTQTEATAVATETLLHADHVSSPP